MSIKRNCFPPYLSLYPCVVGLASKTALLLSSSAPPKHPMLHWSRNLYQILVWGLLSPQIRERTSLYAHIAAPHLLTNCNCPYQQVIWSTDALIKRFAPYVTWNLIREIKLASFQLRGHSSRHGQTTRMVIWMSTPLVILWPSAVHGFGNNSTVLCRGHWNAKCNTELDYMTKHCLCHSWSLMSRISSSQPCLVHISESSMTRILFSR